MLMFVDLKNYERFSVELTQLAADFQMAEYVRCRDTMRELLADYKQYTGKSPEELMWWHSGERRLTEVPLTQWYEIATEAIADLLNIVDKDA